MAQLPSGEVASRSLTGSTRQTVQNGESYDLRAAFSVDFQFKPYVNLRILGSTFCFSAIALLCCSTRRVLQVDRFLIVQGLARFGVVLEDVAQLHCWYIHVNVEVLA